MGTVRFPISPPEKVSLVGSPSISPDGTQIVFRGLDNDDKWSLWVRRMDASIAQRLQGTAGVRGVGGYFWSPDSRSIGFFADGKLKKIDVSGGPSIALTDAALGSDGTWNREGTIVFSSRFEGPLYRVSASGGEATALTALDQSRQERSHSSPYFLPDGRHFVYRAATDTGEEPAIYLESLDSKERKFLVNASFESLTSSSRLAFAPPGYLLFMRGETFMAYGFPDESKSLWNRGGFRQLLVSGQPLHRVLRRRKTQEDQRLWRPSPDPLRRATWVWHLE